MYCNPTSIARRYTNRACAGMTAALMAIGLVAAPATFARPAAPTVQRGSDMARDFRDSRQLVMQVQRTLRDVGIYRGPINGQITPSTRAAIFDYQRQNGLPQTSHLDRDFLTRLGLIGNGDIEATSIDVVRAEAAREANGQLELRIVTRNTSGLDLSESHFRRGDTLHVYVRGFVNGPTRRGVDEMTVTLQPNEWRGISRVLVHGTSDRPVELSSDRFVAPTGALSPSEAEALEARIDSMLEDYSRELRVRYDRRTGVMTMSRANYRENEIELLFALNALASSARLYSEIVRATTDPQAIAGATDLFENQANIVDRTLNRIKSDRATNTANTWRTIRDDFERLNPTNARFTGFGR